MHIPLTKAKAQLTELVRRAEAGVDIILTRHGRGVARLVALKTPVSPAQRRRLLEAVRAAGTAKSAAGESAARSQDFLYDADGLPR